MKIVWGVCGRLSGDVFYGAFMNKEPSENLRDFLRWKPIENEEFLVDYPEKSSTGIL